MKAKDTLTFSLSINMSSATIVSFFYKMNGQPLSSGANVHISKKIGSTEVPERRTDPNI